MPIIVHTGSQQSQEMSPKASLRKTISVIMACFGLLGVCYSYSMIQEDQAFQATRTTANACVWDLSKGQKGSRAVYYSYQAGGRQYRAMDHVTADYWDSLHVGQNITVLLLPDKPESSRSTGSNKSGSSIPLLVLSLGLTILFMVNFFVKPGASPQ